MSPKPLEVPLLPSRLFLESAACSVGCPRLSGSRTPGSRADVLTEIEVSCWQRQLGFGLANSD